MSESEKGKGLKLAVAIAVCIGALVFVYTQWAGNRPTPAAEDEGLRIGERDPEQRQQRRDEMFREVGVTPEQLTQIEALGPPHGRDSSPEERRAHFEAVRDIMTPEQQEQMRERMGQRMGGRMGGPMVRGAEVLPPDQRELFEEMLEERMQERRDRWGGGPPPGGGGPPPPPFLEEAVN